MHQTSVDVFLDSFPPLRSTATVFTEAFEDNFIEADCFTTSVIKNRKKFRQMFAPTLYDSERSVG